jgi:hypothetical protein
MEYIRFNIDNDVVLNSLPIGGSTVGSTSIDYVNSVADNFGNILYRMSPKVRELLKSTNLLSPRAYTGNCSSIVFIGTPHVTPKAPSLPEIEQKALVVDSNVYTNDLSSSQARLHSMEELLKLMPSTEMTITRRERVMDGAIHTGTYNLVKLGVVKGWYRSNETNEDSRAFVIIKPQYLDPLDLDVTLRTNYIVEWEVADINYKYNILSFDQHLDFDGKIHHYAINLT